MNEPKWMRRQRMKTFVWLISGFGRLGSAARMRASTHDVLQEIWNSVVVPNINYVWYGSDCME